MKPCPLQVSNKTPEPRFYIQIHFSIHNSLEFGFSQIQLKEGSPCDVRCHATSWTRVSRNLAKMCFTCLSWQLYACSFENESARQKNLVLVTEVIKYAGVCWIRPLKQILPNGRNCYKCKSWIKWNKLMYGNVRMPGEEWYLFLPLSQ